ncbi:zeta toxin family protein [Pseudomonas sp. LRF_L74]|uniref:zeta toxin family protein n=1 Tax=Pseudomonas sp. LRF_L74 TaxID=3369422 RepID=UPI003F602B06
MSVPRLRVFAGPNGSGKSTIKGIVPGHLIYTYVNADDLEREAKQTGFIDLAPFSIATSQTTLQSFLTQHGLLQKVPQLREQVAHIRFIDEKLDLTAIETNSYHASMIADFIRSSLLERGASFTFETVMSDRSKIEFIRRAKALGYRTYLYFVATEDPAINVNRVAIRVSEGGHDVAPEKIRERYERCLKLLPEAIQVSSRAYIFDNSGEKAELQAEITAGEVVEYKLDEVPDWCIDAVDRLEELAKRG